MRMKRRKRRAENSAPEYGDVKITPWAGSQQGSEDGAGMTLRKDKGKKPKSAKKAKKRLSGGPSANGGEAGRAQASSSRFPSHWVLGDYAFVDSIGGAGRKSEYTFKKRIGQPGAFGEAYIATHPKLGEVAIKNIHKSKLCRTVRNTDYFYKAFRNEITIMKEMRHPNIIRYHDVFEDNDSLYIVMELCRGGELYDRLVRPPGSGGGGGGAGYSEHKAARILKQLLSAVAYMHAMGVVHCDLKPDNFLFDTEDEHSPIKIIDFGMSKHVKPNEYYHRDCGTFYYKAPEVLFEAGYNSSADMWSMGVVMYALCYGALPFCSRARDPHAKRAQTEELIMSGFNPVLFKGEGPWFNSDVRVSKEARSLIAELLQRNPEKRLTATEALQHAWFNDAPVRSMSPLVIKSLKAFHHENKLKSVVLKSLCCKLVSRQEQDELSSAFDEMDTNNDGYVTIRGLQEVLHKCNFHDDEAIKNIFEEIDCDHKGEINYQELLMVYADMKVSCRQERLYMAFQAMQRSEPNKNLITIGDILNAMQRTRSTFEFEAEIRMLFRHYSAEDGTIDYRGFAEMWYGEHARKKLAELQQPLHHPNE